ncbi:hypothetical protein ACHHYP_05210 [Achlya hypogyna]|uniref:Myb-like DNA-binding protein n=1 Tax=Achlya hypogyna TaxID=1202772 RepID=A0A1V9YYM5_ACHHY|nr:hypothetical protein ACHHYP_05210 [Achlya hypogyna]
MTTPFVAESTIMTLSGSTNKSSTSTDSEGGARHTSATSGPRKFCRKASTAGFGPWTAEEHERFLIGIQLHPEGPWKAVADVIQTRSAKQAQTHMQKCKEKILRHRRRRDKALRDVMQETTDDTIRQTAATAAAAPPVVLHRSKHADKLRLQVLEPIPFHPSSPGGMVLSALPEDRRISWSDAVDYFWALSSLSASPSTDTDNDSMGVESPAKYRKRQASDGVAHGPWTPEEHERFLLGIQLHPEGPWKAVADVIQTRSAKQAQTHMQKCKEKILRQRRRRDEVLRDVIKASDDDAIRLVAESATTHPLTLQRSKHAENLRLASLDPLPLDMTTPVAEVTSALGTHKVSWTEAVDYFWLLVSSSSEGGDVARR